MARGQKPFRYIGLALLRSMALLASMSFVAMGLMFWGLFGLVGNIVLIAVVATGNKDAFAPDTPIEA